MTPITFLMENWYRGSEFWWKCKSLGATQSPQGEGKWKFYPINPEPMFANIHHQEGSFGKNWISRSILILISIYPLFANIHHQEGIFTQLILIQCLQIFIIRRKFWENLNINININIDINISNICKYSSWGGSFGNIWISISISILILIYPI